MTSIYKKKAEAKTQAGVIIHKNGSIVYNMCKYYDCLILQIVPASGSWKCECDSSQQAVKVSNGHQNKRLVCYVKTTCLVSQHSSASASLD